MHILAQVYIAAFLLAQIYQIMYNIDEEKRGVNRANARRTKKGKQGPAESYQ